jgi:hypothetical protein
MGEIVHLHSKRPLWVRLLGELWLSLGEWIVWVFLQAGRGYLRLHRYVRDAWVTPSREALLHLPTMLRGARLGLSIWLIERDIRRRHPDWVRCVCIAGS